MDGIEKFILVVYHLYDGGDFKNMMEGHRGAIGGMTGRL